MNSHKYEISVVSGDAEAKFVINAFDNRSAILAAAEMIANNKIKWSGIPDNEWEFLSVFDLGDDNE